MNTTQNQNTGQESRAGSTQSSGNGEAIRQGAQELKNKATEVAQDATREGKVQVEQYRNVAADKVETIAESVKAAAAKLEEGEVGSWSTQIAGVADSMTKFSEGLREKSAEEVMRDVNRMARQNPAIFVGGAVAIGFGLTRLMRATAQPRPQKENEWDESSSMESSADDAYTTSTITGGGGGGGGYGASNLGSGAAASGSGGMDRSSDLLGGSTSTYGSTGGAGTGVGAGSAGSGLGGASSQAGQSGFSGSSGLGQSDSLSGISRVDDDTLGGSSVGSSVGSSTPGDNDGSRSS